MLAGCATPQTFSPYVVEISHPDTYSADLALCRTYAEDYSRGIDIGSIGSGAAVGAAQNAAGGAVNPLVPAVGALGGASTAVINGLDLLDAQAIKVLLRCLERKSDRNHAYLVLDPED